MYHFFSSGSFLSNFYPAEFTDGTHRFKTSEQYYMYRKAVTFNDTQTAQEILKASNPRKAKALGRQVKKFDNKHWDTVKEQAMVNALTLKFTQNPRLLKQLLATGDKILVEASPWDSIWGIGLSLDDPRKDDPAQWRGQNLLGKCLMQVRSRLSEFIKQQSTSSRC